MNERIVPVLLGGDSNVYGMARSFYEEYGVFSHVICKGCFHVCKNTKLIASLTVEPKFETEEVFVETLRQFAWDRRNRQTQESDVREHLVLVACADGYAKLLVDQQERLKEDYDFAVMSPSVFRMLSSKQRFYDTCARYGLDYPKTYIVDQRNWADFEPSCGYPCVVKPSNSVKYWNCSYSGKKKAFEIRSQAEYALLCERIYASEYDDSLIVQEYIPGDNSAMRVLNCYSNQDGKVVMMTLGRVLLEEQTPMGIGSYGAIMTDLAPALCAKVKDFLESVGYVGYSNFDLKYDSRNGTYKFLEINPRQGRSSYFVTASGKNLARYLVDDVVFKKSNSADTAIPVDRALWSAVPFSLIKKYVKNEFLIEDARRLKREGRFRRAYLAKYDINIARLFYFALNQVKEIAEYARWFNKRHIDD